MSRGKNAYEIRLETLHLARDILNAKHDDEMELWRAHKDGDLTISMEGIRATEKPEVPALPDPVNGDAVLSEAEKLYAFIEKTRAGDSRY